VIAEPPVDDGALHVTWIEVFPEVAVTCRGAVGVPKGVTGADGELDDPAPAAFVATTDTE